MEDVFENFTASVTRAYKYISQIKKHESLTFGIKGIHVMSMIYLNKYKNGLTVSELAALCLEDKAAVSRNLDSLKDMGYVRFADSNAGKRRGRRAVLTPEGKKKAEEINKVVECIVGKIREGLSDQEEMIFYKVFSRINDNFSKYMKDIG